MEQEPQPVQPVSVETVYATLSATLSIGPERATAERQLKEWEVDAAPGFIGALVKVICEVNAVPEELRLLAAVVGKNAVGSSWRKMLATREWSRVPEEEKEYVRSALAGALFSDPSRRVALQIMLLITNIARFDAPRPWEALLPSLAAAAGPGGGLPLAGRQRALKALKFVLAAMQDKQFVMERPPGVLAFSVADRRAEAEAERDLLFQQARSLVAPLRQQWEQAAAGLLQRGQDWEALGALSAAYLSVLRELIMLLPDWEEGVGPEMEAFLQDGCQAAALCVGVLFTGGAAAAAAAAAVEEPFRDLVGKTWERLLGCALAVLASFPLRFAKFVPAWVTLCMNTALVGMDAATIHTVRAKSRVLLTRFVAQVLLNGYYRPDALLPPKTPAGFLNSLLRPGMREQLEAAAPDLKAASDCLDQLLSEQDGRCAALVQALVSKYIALSPDELAEWESDPEGFARQVDVETSPEADTPRPCGVALLECMLERAQSPVAAALLAQAGALQSQPLTPENILLREATYRAVGEVFPHVQSKVDFKSWYESELRLMLQSAELTGLYGDVLRARALWLVGVCGGELQPGPWREAYALCVRLVQTPDLVVALMAVSAVTASIGHVLEEQQFVKRPEDDKRLILEGPLADLEQSEDEDVSAQCTAEYNAHMAAVEESLDALMVGCFALLPRLGEVESMVRVLQCVSVAVELMGDKLRPHLATITTALPQVWAAITQRSGESTGALARLHSALISTVTHLISRLGSTAMQDPHVAGVLLPLLSHATNLGSSESEPLIEEGLKLWLAVLRSISAITPPLQDLLAARLPAILRRGQDNAAAYSVAEGYLLHGGVEAAGPVLPLVTAAAIGTIGRVIEEAEKLKAAQQFGGIAQHMVPEAAAALSLISVLQRMADAAGAPVPPEIQAGVAAAAGVAAYDFGGGTMRLPGKAIAIIEACFELATRAVFRDVGSLASIFGPQASRDAETRFLNRWITLSSAREIGELFVPALAALGRSRRHDAVVGLCALLVGGGSEGMADLGRQANTIVLGLKCLKEQPLYRADQEKLARLAPADPEHEDQLLLRRLLLLRADPMAAVDAGEALRAAAAKVIAHHGREALCNMLEGIDPAYREQFEEVVPAVG